MLTSSTAIFNFQFQCQKHTWTMCANDFRHNTSWLGIHCSSYNSSKVVFFVLMLGITMVLIILWHCWLLKKGWPCWSDLLTSFDVSQNRSCFAVASPRLLPAERFAGCLQCGNNSKQCFTEQHCFSSGLVCIFWHFCLKSHTFWMNASCFVHVTFSMQSPSFIAMPWALWTSEGRFLSRPV